MDERFIDIVNLRWGQSLIMGYKPEKLPMNIINQKYDKEKPDIKQFGLFDKAQPNYNTFYPDVKPEDFIPKDDEFITPVFRALSSVIVHKKTNPIDFTKKGVLSSSLNLLKGQTINIDHEQMVGNAIGVVSNVEWQNAYTTSEGIKVPSGINAVLKIDAKSHPNIARGIMMDPPSIHSNSVTVEFEWGKSHNKMDNEEFFGKLGQFDDKGELIRRIVTKILRYHETSLVAHGADPYAQIIKDGKINNARYADSIYSLSALGKEKPPHYFFSYKTDTSCLSEEDTILKYNIQNSDSENQQKNKYMKEFLASLAVLLKFKEDDEINQETIADALSEIMEDYDKLQLKTENHEDELNSLKDKKEQLKTQVQGLEEKISTHKEEMDSLKETSEIGKISLDATRKETKRLYNVLKGSKADATIIAMIEKADFKTLTSFMKQYTDELEEKFPGKCKDCGSKNVERLSTAIPKEGIQPNEEEEEEEENTTKDSHSVIKNIIDKKRKKSFYLHDTIEENK